MSGNDEKKEKGTKRKRTINTSKEQYEIYLECIETDFAFKSGTINPTLGENYLGKRWEELSNKLNAVGDGPRLKVDEWKKRFTDWKYAIKSKFRKICEHRGKTGSGPHTSLFINDLEDRALSAWGKITVLGNTKITQYEGLAPENNISSLDITPNDTSFLPDNYQNYSNINLITNETETTENNEDTISSIPGPLIENLSNQIPLVQKSTEKTRKKRTKPLTVLTEQLLRTNEETVKTMTELNQIVSKFSENYICLKKEKLEFKKLKLQFEIEKFKFANPEFKFEI